MTQQALEKNLQVFQGFSEKKKKIALLSKYPSKNHVVELSVSPFLKQIKIWRALNVNPETPREVIPQM